VQIGASILRRHGTGAAPRDVTTQVQYRCPLTAGLRTQPSALPFTAPRTPCAALWPHPCPSGPNALLAVDVGGSRRLRAAVVRRCFRKLNARDGNGEVPNCCADEVPRRNSLMFHLDRRRAAMFRRHDKSQFIRGEFRRPRVSGSAARKHHRTQVRAVIQTSCGMSRRKRAMHDPSRAGIHSSWKRPLAGTQAWTSVVHSRSRSSPRPDSLRSSMPSEFRRADFSRSAYREQFARVGQFTWAAAQSHLKRLHTDSSELVETRLTAGERAIRSLPAAREKLSSLFERVMKPTQFN